MDIPSVRVIVHDGTTYVDVVEYTNSIIYDLMKAPPEMVASRGEIINALQQYATQALSTDVGGASNMTDESPALCAECDEELDLHCDECGECNCDGSCTDVDEDEEDE